eukprot:5803512-Lingulodinium_polyedra.AAC.1
MVDRLGKRLQCRCQPWQRIASSGKHRLRNSDAAMRTRAQSPARTSVKLTCQCWRMLCDAIA